MGWWSGSFVKWLAADHIWNLIAHALISCAVLEYVGAMRVGLIFIYFRPDERIT